MVCLDLLLIDPDDVEVHLAETAASIFKPVDIEELIDIEAVLLSIALK